MPKILSLFVFILFFTLLYAEEEQNKIEVNAKYLESTKTTMTGKNGVVVYYNNSVIKANSASYNKETKILVLDGRVEMIGYKGTKNHTDHMEINTETNEVKFKKLFFTSQNDVWLYSNKAQRSEGNYTLGNSVLSSCDANDPLWKMVFERSHYDSEDEYMKIYNAKVYFKDVPIIYSPYMAFSTNNKRSSGLLFPLMGYTSGEGFIYEQPIFWAISSNMDLEINPQVRTRRSLGGYATFRFADSSYSSGELRVGYFKDKDSYSEAYDLPNDSHYGLEFNYESSKLFSDSFGKGFTDGLYINSTFLNDIDYLNLQKTSLTHFGLTPLQESRLNYFIYNSDYYTGVNAKYFIDTRKVNNNDTLQILPSVQFHKYLTHFLIEDFTYSVDFKINNFYREEGSTLKQAELKIPLEFTTSFFDDFINISFGENLYYSKFFFANEEYLYDEFEYYSNQHKVELFTDLTKKYDNFTHVLQPSFKYLKPGNESQKPVPVEFLSKEQKELFTVGLPEENYLFSLSHYFYDENMKLRFYQRFSQNYYVNREYELADMTNEMQYNVGTWQFYNNMVYAHEFKKIRESSSRISLDKGIYNVTLGHSFKQILPDDIDSSIIPANDITFNFVYNYNEHIGFNGAMTYNIDESESKQWLLGGSYKQDCWSMLASLRQEITPRPTGATLDKSFFIQFNFIPFGTIGSGN
jgi:LPS-assembly protein